MIFFSRPKGVTVSAEVCTILESNIFRIHGSFSAQLFLLETLGSFDDAWHLAHEWRVCVRLGTCRMQRSGLGWLTITEMARYIEFKGLLKWWDTCRNDGMIWKLPSWNNFHPSIVILNLVKYWNNWHFTYLAPLTDVEFGLTIHSEEYKYHFMIQYGGADLVFGNIKAKISSTCLKNTLLKREEIFYFWVSWELVRHHCTWLKSPDLARGCLCRSFAVRGGLLHYRFNSRKMISWFPESCFPAPG